MQYLSRHGGLLGLLHVDLDPGSFSFLVLLSYLAI